MLNFKHTLELMRSNNAPYYRLCTYPNQYAEEGTTVSSNFSEKNEVTLDKSIADINRTCTMIASSEPDTIFGLECATSKTANGNSKFGVYKFKIEKEPETESITSNLGKVDDPNFDIHKVEEYVQRGVNIGKKLTEPMADMTEKRVQLAIREEKLAADRRELDRDRREWEKEVARKEEELKVLEQKYKSRTEASKAGLEEFGNAMIPKLAAMFGAKAKTLQTGLGAAPSSKDEDFTKEEVVINEIADYLHSQYSEGKLNEAELKWLLGQIPKMIEHIKNPENHG